MSTTYTKMIHYAQGPETLRKFRVVAQSAFTRDGTNYWTFTLRHRRKAVDGTLQANGELVGTALSLATHDLVAGTPVTIFDDEHGRPLADGEILVMYAVSTGSPAVPEGIGGLKRVTKNVR